MASTSNIYYYFGMRRLIDIADAIRYKTGVYEGITIAEMPDKIASIEGGGGPESYMALYNNNIDNIINAIVEED